MSAPIPSAGDPLDAVAEEFLARLRRGERPALSEFTGRYPDLAERIRDLFPTLAELEVVGPTTGPDAAGPDAPPPWVGEYRILREVGRGGMGLVYEAVQESLGRHVALKVLPAGQRDRGVFLERFRREAKAAARLHHTNIVPVFGVGEAGGVHYYAMQYIHGQGLDAVLAEVRRLRGLDPTSDDPTVTHESLACSAARGLMSGQFAPGPDTAVTPTPSAAATSGSSSALAGQPEARYCREVARLGVQAAEALHHAHGQGVLHRDVKPSNLLLDTEGVLWVTDFGLAKADDSDNLTGTGDLVGTLRYMAPERFRGQADVRCDVYSLGVTLYEMLTLRPPYDEADRLRLVRQIERGQPAQPRQLDSRIPRDLETVVVKAMAPEPADRYPSAGAMAEDLHRVLADRPVRARRHSLREQAWRWCRRNPAVAGLAGAVAALVLAVAVGSTVASLRLAAALSRAVSAEHDSNLRLWDALKAEAHGTRVVSRREGQRFESLATIARAVTLGHQLGLPPANVAELRNEAIAALTLADLHVTHWWEGLPPGCDHPNFSGDVSTYCRTEPDGSVSVRRVEGDMPLCRLPTAGGPTRAYLSPDGRFAVQRLPGSGHFAVWRLGPEPELVGQVKRPSSQDAVEFHPSRDLFVVWSTDYSVTVYDLASVRPVYHLPAEGRPGYTHIAFHPTEPLVAQSTYEANTVEVRDLATGRVVASWVPPWRGGTTGCAWHPDGRTLAVPQGDGPAVMLVEFDPAARTFGRHRQLNGVIPDGGIAHFNRAGDRLLVESDWGNQLQVHDVGTGRLVFEVPPTLTVVKRPHFDPSGRRLAAARRGTQLGLWSVGDGREYRVLAPGRLAPGGGGRPPAVSPDGRIVAANLGDGLGLYDLDSGRELAMVPFALYSIAAVPAGRAVFEPSGALLTNSMDGCFRWPLRPDPSAPDRLRLGPPERLGLHEGANAIAVSGDGRVVVQAMYAGYGEEPYTGGWILHTDRPGEPRRVATGTSMVDAAVSPDGRWAAFGFHMTQTIVFEAATGREVWRSPVGGHHCRFTPDGRWLATEADGGRVYSVGTWEPGARLGAGLLRCISPDSRLAVLSTTEGYFRLVEIATGREVTRLEDPERHGGRGQWFTATFTPDGTRLVAPAMEGLRVWDLRAIRRELAALDLDWVARPYPPAEEPVMAPTPFTVEVVGAESLLNNPDDANELAWRLVTGPKTLRDPERALPLAEKAVKLAPQQWAYHNTLGVVYFRLGRYAEAMTPLNTSLEHNADQSGGFDLYVLAMCHHRLGHVARARDCFDRAVRWQEQAKVPPDEVEELNAFRSEAAAVLRGPPGR